MGSSEQNYDDSKFEQRRQRDTYRARRPQAARSRSRKTSAPGGFRQRRNKHWNW